jgi:hypothetical protein
VTLRQISQFTTDNPQALGRQLSQLESNVVAETSSIRNAMLAVPTLVSFVAKAGVVINVVAFGSAVQLSVDSSQASLSVIFPKLTTSYFGFTFTLIRRSALNNVVCQPLDPTVPCNGSLTWPTFTGATPRVVRFYCDPSGYYYQ